MTLQKRAWIRLENLLLVTKIESYGKRVRKISEKEGCLLRIGQRGEKAGFGLS